MPKQASPKAVEWLRSKIEERGWSIRETARQADIAHPTIADIISMNEMPSLETCKALAKAFNTDPRMVLEIFGLLDPHPESTLMQQHILSLVGQLPEDEQAELAAIAEYKVERRKKVKGGKKTERT